MTKTGLGLVLTIRYFGRPRIPANSGWFGLIANLEAAGITVQNDTQPSEPSHLLIIDYVKKDERNWPSVPSGRRFLVATEPVTVNPIQFSKRVSRKFLRIIVPSERSPKAENARVYEGGYLNPSRYKTAYTNDGNRQGWALINENKFSFVPESNYILRSRLVLEAVDAGLNFSIAGRNWTRGPIWTLLKVLHHILIAFEARRIKLRINDLSDLIKLSLRRRQVKQRWAGIVPDSLAYLSKFKVSVVIENESSYVSEKFHAALLAGCQCVYVGPELNTGDFPDKFLFQSSPDSASIMKNLRLALETPYKISDDELWRYLESSNFVKNNGVDRRNAWVARKVATWMEAGL